MMELLRTTEEAIQEKPWHRLAIKLHLLGWSNQDIAHELGQASSDVSAIITSKQGREKIADAIQKDEKLVEKILEAAGVDSIYTLIKLRDNAKTESVRYNAAKTIIEHGYGKPLTKIKRMAEETTEDPIEEAKKIEEELGIKYG